MWVGGRIHGVYDLYKVCVLLCTMCWSQSPWCIQPILSKRVSRFIMCVGGRALGVFHHDYPSACDAEWCVLEAESLVYLNKMIRSCVLLCTLCWWQYPWCIWPKFNLSHAWIMLTKRVCCSEVCDVGRALGVSAQDYPSVCADVCWRQRPWCIWTKIIQAGVLLCTMCWRQSPWCI